MKIFIGMETSGALRRAFAALGHDVISCDLLPAQDGAPTPTGPGNFLTPCHIQGDGFAVLAWLRSVGWVPDMAVFHPTCTYLTTSAAWAFNDPDFERYPGVGYHQRLKPGTLFGKARRDARAAQVEHVKALWALDIERVVIENPVGALSSLWMKPTQTIQPYDFGDDASKRTCLWIRGLKPLKPTRRCAGRMVEWPRGSGKLVERWANQTDSGQSNLTPSDDRWQDRSDTFPGVAQAFAMQWGW